MTNPNLQLGAVVLSSSAKLDQWEKKAGFYSDYIDRDKTPDYSKSEVIDSKSIINITDKIDAFGVNNF